MGSSERLVEVVVEALNLDLVTITHKKQFLHYQTFIFDIALELKKHFTNNFFSFLSTVLFHMYITTLVVSLLSCIIY